MVRTPARNGAYNRRAPKPAKITRWHGWELELAAAQARRFLPDPLGKARKVAEEMQKAGRL